LLNKPQIVICPAYPSTFEIFNTFKKPNLYEIADEFIYLVYKFFSGDAADGKLSKAEGGGNNDSSDNKSNEDENGIGILETMLDNLDAFVIEPTPQGCVVKCRITRDRKGMDRGKLKSERYPLTHQ
jgi:hypothetical protein